MYAKTKSEYVFATDLFSEDAYISCLLSRIASLRFIAAEALVYVFPNDSYSSIIERFNNVDGLFKEVRYIAYGY